MKNIKAIRLVIFFLFLVLNGYLGCGGSNNTGPVSPPANSTQVISFASSGTPSTNSVYLEKVSINNDEITLAVKVKGGSDVYGAALWLTYDGSKIKYVSASSTGSYLGSDLTFSKALLNGQEGTLLLGIDKKGNASGSNGDGILLAVVFKALTTQLNTNISFNDTNSMLKSPAGNITGTNWFGGNLSYE